MDFSVRQLDSTQRRCVLNVNYGSVRWDYVGFYYNSTSYVCEADGKYDITYTNGNRRSDNYHVSQTAYIYVNGSCVSSLTGHSYQETDGNDGYYWEIAHDSTSTTEYLSKGDVISLQNVNTATIYLTPYK